MDELVYKKIPPTQMSTTRVHENAAPTLQEIALSQEAQLRELAQVRFGIKGSLVVPDFVPLPIFSGLSEKELVRLLITVPSAQQGDQILYALAHDRIDATLANHLLSMLQILQRLFKDQENKEIPGISSVFIR